MRGLEKSFGGNVVLRGVDLEVPRGAVAALLGASGSGKTTLLRTIAGFEAPERGAVRIGGSSVEGAGRRVPPEGRRIGYVPQEGALFPHLDVVGNVGFGLARRCRRDVGDLLDLVGMAELADRFPSQLSGGQQQRVALARALAIEPEVVLLDEPFSSLDPNLRAAVRDDVRRILRQSGATALLVTHDQDEALSIADLVAVLRDGTVVQCASPRDLYGEPVDAELAGFLGEANVLPGWLRAGVVETSLGRLPARLAGSGGGEGAGPPPASTAGAALEVRVLVRPEQLCLAPAGRSGAGGIADGLPGVVERLDYHGHDALVVVRPEQGEGSPAIVVRTLGDPGVGPGSRVLVRAEGAALVWPAGEPPAGE